MPAAVATTQVSSEGSDESVGRLYTSLKKDPELRRRYLRMKQKTGVEDKDALKQGLVRLIEEFEDKGELTIRKLPPELTA